MFKKTCLVFLITSHLAYAETCPSVVDIKLGKLLNWIAYDLDNGEPLDQQQMATFQTEIATFAFASSIADAPEGSGHCYYYGKIPDYDYLNVYLAKFTLSPDLTQGNWHQTTVDVMECNSHREQCRFNDPVYSNT